MVIPYIVIGLPAYKKQNWYQNKQRKLLINCTYPQSGFSLPMKLFKKLFSQLTAVMYIKGAVHDRGLARSLQPANVVNEQYLPIKTSNIIL